MKKHVLTKVLAMVLAAALAAVWMPVFAPYAVAARDEILADQPFFEDCNDNDDEFLTICEDDFPWIADMYNAVLEKNIRPASLQEYSASDYVLESEHIIWGAGVDHLVGNITPDNFSLWLSRLDIVYDAYADLCGRVPNGGQKIPIIEGNGNYWASAGYDSVILYNPGYIARDMRGINATGSWDFVMMHELGHIFDNDGGYDQWVFNAVFNAEGSANLKVVYALENTEAVVVDWDNPGKLMGGEVIADRWYDIAVAEYHAGTLFTAGRPHESLIALLVPFLRQTNWQALKDTYRSYHSGVFDLSDFLYSNNRDIHKLWDFFDRLSRFGGGLRAEDGFYLDSTDILRVRFPKGHIARREIFFGEFRFSSFSEVTIPRFIHTIRSDAFSDSTVERLTLENGVVQIGPYAFANCRSLETVVIPGTLQYIDSYAFLYCMSLRDVSILSGNISIAYGAFLWSGKNEELTPGGLALTKLLSMDKPAYASSFERNFVAGYVTNGRKTNRWSSLFTDDEWIYIDLEQVCSVKGVLLNWETAFAKTFNIQVSLDGETWITVAANVSGSRGAQMVAFDAVDARYVKMQGLARQTEWGYSLYMMDVYGGPAQPSESVSVTGEVKSYNPGNPTTLKLMQGGEVICETTIEEAPGYGQVTQGFTFENVAPGDYTLVVTKEAHTKFTVQTVTVGNQNVDLTRDSRPEVSLMTLRCGDINNDGMINDTDLAILWLAANYNKSTAAQGVNPGCDLNGDGMINDADLAILWLAANYNKGAVAVS